MQNVTEKVEGEKHHLFASFKDQGITQWFSEESVKLVYQTLVEKMLNLRKNDMQKSWDRIQKRGGKSIMLNLRDELKPYAAKCKKV